MIRFITFLTIVIMLMSCEQKRTYNNSVKDNKWFVVKFIPLCDEQKGVFLDLDKLNKHGKFNPYNTVQVSSKDSVAISFDFISNCCATFSGEVELKKDTLILKYGHDGEQLLCDCYCDYRMTYKLSKGKRQWKSVKMVSE